jgi:hypothetical protein
MEPPPSASDVGEQLRRACRRAFFKCRDTSEAEAVLAAARQHGIAAHGTSPLPVPSPHQRPLSHTPHTNTHQPADVINLGNENGKVRPAAAFARGPELPDGACPCSP